MGTETISHTILIQRSIIVITSSNERTTRSPAKIGSSMILKTHSNRIKPNEIIQGYMVCFKQKELRAIQYHVIVDEWSSLLYKLSNWESHVFSRAIWDCTSKFSIPSKCGPQNNKKPERGRKIFVQIVLLGWRIKDLFLLTFISLPARPSFSPHGGFISLVWRKVIAVETIASINLLGHTRMKSIKWCVPNIFDSHCLDSFKNSCLVRQHGKKKPKRKASPISIADLGSWEEKNYIRGKLEMQIITTRAQRTRK